MGYNTSMMLLNDGLHVIEAHPEEFTANLVRAVRELTVLPKDASLHGNVRCHNHANVAQVIHTEHADFIQIVGVGGNYGKLLGMALTGGHMHESDDKVAILKALAKDLGYTVSKKSTHVVH